MRIRSSKFMKLFDDFRLGSWGVILEKSKIWSTSRVRGLEKIFFKAEDNLRSVFWGIFYRIFLRKTCRNAQKRKSSFRLTWMGVIWGQISGPKVIWGHFSFFDHLLVLHGWLLRVFMQVKVNTFFQHCIFFYKMHILGYPKNYHSQKINRKNRFPGNRQIL